MNAHKEFEGKNLDEAIRDACEYYGVERERLEIDILNDAKSGIFGLVGAKKARIRASRATPVPSSLLDDIDAPMDVLMAESSGPGNSIEEPAPTAKQRNGSRYKNPFPDSLSDPLGRGRGKQRKPKSPETPPDVNGNLVLPPDTGRRRERPEKNARNERKEARGGNLNFGESENARRRSGEKQDEKAVRRPKPKAAPNKDTGYSDKNRLSPDDGLRDELPELSLAACDKEGVSAVVRDVVLRLAAPIVGDVPCSVTVTDERVSAVLTCGDDSGLLVGREGQTLAAVQYLAGRMSARILGGSLRLRVDADNYRERQDDRLKELALALAAKVKVGKRPQSTRPLTAYQRRIIHLALEDDPQVQTVSKGEGSQRRVIVQFRRQHDEAEEE